MEDNYYIKTLLEKIESADPKSFSQFAHEHPICFQEKKAMALLYKLEQHTVELVKLSRRIVELSREMESICTSSMIYTRIFT